MAVDVADLDIGRLRSTIAPRLTGSLPGQTVHPICLGITVISPSFPRLESLGPEITWTMIGARAVHVLEQSSLANAIFDVSLSDILGHVGGCLLYTSDAADE